MGQPVARQGDSAAGVCTAHRSPVAWTGVIDSASGGFTVDGQEAAAINDTGSTSCGHRFRIIGASTILTGLGKRIARKDDPVEVIQGGSGVITSGSPTTTSE